MTIPSGQILQVGGHATNGGGVRVLGSQDSGQGPIIVAFLEVQRIFLVYEQFPFFQGKIRAFTNAGDSPLEIVVALRDSFSFSR